MVDNVGKTYTIAPNGAVIFGTEEMVEQIQKESWDTFIRTEQEKPYYKDNLIPYMREEYSKYECYPAKENIFRAMYSIKSPRDVKAVIIGQDPYHEPGQANGLAFSVNKGCVLPPSLKNIIKEICDEYATLGINIPEDSDKVSLFDGDLTYLAEQGVLLLNSTLTVRRGKANSHEDSCWQTFTDNLISYLDMLNQPMVFMLWGKYAKSKSRLITGNNIKILTASHPSPFSANRGFFGCGHFVQCNEYLEKMSITPIDWLGVRP